MSKINTIWNKISFFGLTFLDKTEAIEKYREIVLINRLISFILICTIIYIPIEIIFNSFDLVPYILIEISILGATLLFNYCGYFKFSRIYFFFSAIASILPMMYVVPVGAGNEFLLLPVAILPVILFHNKWFSAIMSLSVLILFFVVLNTREFIDPIIEVSNQQILFFRNIYLGVVFFLVFSITLYFKIIVEDFEIVNIEKNRLLNLSNTEITSSINYAKRIQNAILPSDSYICEYLPESFVLYLPKDIVAGDFYWMKTVNDQIIFAVADCTGHGVPGAMVSVVCSNALNQSIKETESINPSKIIEATREIVKENLKSDEENVSDGMDIALCSLDPKTNIIQFTGAYNSLYIIRDKKIIELKGDRQPVGKHHKEIPFTCQNYQLEKNDLLYIFTDGYTDQFGGDAGKKLLKNNFKTILLDIVDEPLSKQKQLLLNSLNTWMGDLEQVDDICVMGIKIC